MFSVETHSFLPNEQSDGGDFACQCETRHRWFHSSGKASLVEILERSTCSGSPGGRSLEDIFRSWLWLRLSPRMAKDFFDRWSWPPTKRYSALPVGLQRQTDVRPELSLGAKAMGRLDQSNQECCPDRTIEGIWRSNFTAKCFLLSCSSSRRASFAGPLRHRTAGSKFGATAHSRFGNLPQPFCPIAWCVHLLAGTRNRPTSIDGLQSTHHPRQISRDRQITAGQFLQSSYAMLSVINRLKLVPVQQLRQFARVVAIILVPYFSRVFLRGSQTSTCATCGLSRSCNQEAQVPSSKVTCKLPRRPRKNWSIVSAFVSRMASITSLPRNLAPRRRSLLDAHPAQYTWRHS